MAWVSNVKCYVYQSVRGSWPCPADIHILCDPSRASKVAGAFRREGDFGGAQPRPQGTLDTLVVIQQVDYN